MTVNFIEQSAVRGHTSGKRFFFSIILGVLLVFFMGTTAYYYRAYTNLRGDDVKIIQGGGSAGLDEADALVAKIGQYLDLPKDEKPTVATISDPTKLNDQAFFAKAVVGDKVLIYSKAKKAILYDPVANKVMEVAPLSIGTQTSGSTSTP